MQYACPLFCAAPFTFDPPDANEHRIPADPLFKVLKISDTYD